MIQANPAKRIMPMVSTVIAGRTAKSDVIDGIRLFGTK